jgi:hypothetical protein
MFAQCSPNVRRRQRLQPVSGALRREQACLNGATRGVGQVERALHQRQIIIVANEGYRADIQQAKVVKPAAQLVPDATVAEAVTE